MVLLAVNEQEHFLAGGGDPVDDAWVQMLEEKVRHPRGPAGNPAYYLRVKNSSPLYSAVRCNHIEKLPSGVWKIRSAGGATPFIQNNQWVRTLDAPRRRGQGAHKNDYYSPIAFQGRLVFLNTKHLQGSRTWRQGKSAAEVQAFAKEQERRWKEADALHRSWINVLHHGVQFPNGNRAGLDRFREVITSSVVREALSPEGLPDGSEDELAHQRLTDAYLGYVTGQNIEHVDRLMLAEYRTGKTGLNIAPRVIQMKDPQTGQLRDFESFREVSNENDAVLQGQGLYQIALDINGGAASGGDSAHLRAKLLGLAVSSINGQFEDGHDGALANRLVREDALWYEHFRQRDPLPALGGSHKNREDRGLWEESPGMQLALREGWVAATEAKWITGFGRGARDETYGRNGDVEDSVRFLQALDEENYLQEQGQQEQEATPLGDLVKADGNAFGAWGMLVFGRKKDEGGFDPAAFARTAAPLKEQVSHDFKAPLVDVRHMNEDMQKFFGVRLLRNGDATPLIRPSSNFGAVVAMHYDPSGLYPKHYAFKGYRPGEPGSKGVFLESHPFPHVVTAKDGKAVLRYCLAKYGTDGKLYMVETVVPFGYGLFVNKNVIHGDTYVKGTVLIYLEPQEQYADSALVRSADGKMGNYYKESDVPDFPFPGAAGAASGSATPPAPATALAPSPDSGSCGSVVCNGATAGMTIGVAFGCGIAVAVVMFFLMRMRSGGNNRIASVRGNVDAE